MLFLNGIALIIIHQFFVLIFFKFLIVNLSDLFMGSIEVFFFYHAFMTTAL